EADGGPDEGIEADLRREAAKLRRRHLLRDRDGRERQPGEQVASALRRRPTTERREEQRWPPVCCTCLELDQRRTPVSARCEPMTICSSSAQMKRPKALDQRIARLFLPMSWSSPRYNRADSPANLSSAQHSIRGEAIMDTASYFR